MFSLAIVSITFYTIFYLETHVMVTKEPALGNSGVESVFVRLILDQMTLLNWFAIGMLISD